MHMSRSFMDKVFCSWCGEKLEKINDLHLRCQSCGISDYNNPKGATAIIITNEKRELLCAVRSEDPGKGKLDMPGGFVDGLETGEAGSIRELREEIGLIGIQESDLKLLFSDVNPYVFQNISYPVLCLYYHLEINSDKQLTANDDVASISWLDPATIDYAHDFWTPELGASVKRYLLSQNML